MMTLHIYFRVSHDRVEAFRRMYEDEYAPALQKQDGYVSSRLLEVFPSDLAEEIEAAATEFNLQIGLTFDTEENRRRWVDTAEHAELWPRVIGLAQKVAWRAFFERAVDHGQPAE